MCSNCPFRIDGKQIKLNKDRFDEIKQSLTSGGYNSQDFLCHKTTKEEGWNWDEVGEDDAYHRAGGELLCAGAIEYQEAQGASSQYRRVAERLTA